MFAFVGISLLMTLFLGGYLHFNSTSIIEEPLLNKRIPSILIKSLEGTIIPIDSTITRKTVLIFFSVTCPHCESEMTNLNNLYRHFKDSLQFIALSTNSSLETQRFTDSFTISFPVYTDTTHNALIQFRTTTIPALYFIDQQHCVRQFRQGKHDMQYLFSLLSNFVSAHNDSSHSNML